MRQFDNSTKLQNMQDRQVEDQDRNTVEKMNMTDGIETNEIYHEKLKYPLLLVGGQSREGSFIPWDMMVSDMFTSCNDFEISKKISLYASYAALYANEPSLDKER